MTPTERKARSIAKRIVDRELTPPNVGYDDLAPEVHDYLIALQDAGQQIPGTVAAIYTDMMELLNLGSL